MTPTLKNLSACVRFREIRQSWPSHWGLRPPSAILPGMGILIGMDEAGYGPNFGPLVVAATAWEVDEEVGGRRSGVRDVNRTLSAANERTAAATMVRRTKLGAARTRLDGEIDLYRLLRNIVAKSASERRIAIADSKVLYHPGLGLRQLERGVHAVLLTMRQSLSCWSAIVQFCGADPDGHHRRFCWPDGCDCSLPVDA